VYYEDVKVKKGETVSGIGAEYGYNVADWRKIWDDPKNHALVKKRVKPEHLQIDDVLWVKIPWHTVTRIVTATANGASILVQRDGGAGKRMSWVQTVYQHNQPIGSTAPFCVDGCPADDDLPFYWTDAEIASPPTWVQNFAGDPKVELSKTFADSAGRGAPTAAMGTTKWRAIVSIAVVNEKRITVYGSLVWGFDLTPAGISTKVGPRAATHHEREGHLNLLRNGIGLWIIDFTVLGFPVHLALTNPFSFGAQGWTFRSPP
jgi:hypothetical protein